MIFNVSEKDRVELDEYKGEYSISPARMGQDGKFYKQWAKYCKGKDTYQERNWPVKVSLGDRSSAIALCRAILEDLGTNDVVVNNTGHVVSSTTDEPDIPF
jgi:hypothetical protein